MLKYRLIFGPIMIALLLGAIWLDGYLDTLEIRGTVLESLFLGRDRLPSGLLLLSIFLVLIVLTSRELAAIFRAKSIEIDAPGLAVAGLTGCLLMFVLPYNLRSSVAIAIFTTAVVLLFIGSMIRYSWLHQRTQGAVAIASATMFGFVYLGVLPGYLVGIRRWHSAWVIAAILLITKSCDIGAYFTGRAFGRHKLIPWLSPGKTWEGLAGGVALSGLVAGLLALIANQTGISGTWVLDEGQRLFQPDQFHIARSIAAGCLLGAVGQFGDLTASLFKRDAGIKDSGSTIPGFGGVLDVIDSPVITAPLAYWMLELGKHLG